MPSDRHPRRARRTRTVPGADTGPSSCFWAVCPASPPSPRWACARAASNTPAAPAGRPHGRARAATAHRRPGRPSCPGRAWLDALARHAQPPPRYDDKVVAVFVHHTDSPNGYDCADAPRIIRYLYAGQTGARDWDDIGYNFLVDRCGTIYEGRAGGVDRPVTGAHTQGFNHRTAGIAALGTFTAGIPVPQAMVDAIAALAAWKLGLSGVDPRADGPAHLQQQPQPVRRRTTVALPALAGHRDAYMTSCPGAALTARLPEIRRPAARLQGAGRSVTGSHRNALGDRSGSSHPRVLRSCTPQTDRRRGT